MSEQRCVKCGHNMVDRHGECRQCIDWQRHVCEFSEAAVDASKEYVRLINDLATMPMDALMDEHAPRSAVMNSVGILRHMQERARALISQHQETK